MITVDDLQRISLNPDPVAYDLAGDVDALVPEMKKGEITTPKRMAAFLGNVAQETDGLKTLEEYGTEAYFRSFLGNQWEYHGRGYLMNTWLDAYRKLSAVLGVDLVRNPDRLSEDKELAARAAVWFWTANNLNWWADNGTLWNVSGIINTGGPNPAQINGWYERVAAHERAVAALGTPVPVGILTVAQGTRFYDAIRYLEPAIDRARYWIWRSGIIPDGPGAYAHNSKAPAIDAVIRGGLFCAAVGSLSLRRVGKRVATRGDARYDGGVAAYWRSPWGDGYFTGYDEPFDLAKAKRWARETRSGVLIGREYSGGDSSPLAHQGHVAILLPSGYVLQSWLSYPNGKSGLNWDYTIEADHAGWYYTRMVHPENWIEYEGDEF